MKDKDERLPEPEELNEASGRLEPDEELDEEFDEELGEELDGEPKKPGKKGKAGLVIGIIAAAALLGAGGWYYCTNFMSKPQQTEAEAEAETPTARTMPDLVYETEEVAEEILSENGIKADILFVCSEKVPKGIVALQSVSAGQEIGDEGVTVYVSMGPAPTPTPEPSPLPTPTPKATAKPKAKATAVPEIIIPQPVVTPCPTG